MADLRRHLDPQGTAEPTEALDFRLLFEGVPGLFLVLRPDPGFTILGASDAYLRATLTGREAIVGRGLFEVFPDNPDDPHASGTSNLRASLERVVAGQVTDAMAVQKYDIRRPESEGGGFEERHWSPVNSAVHAASGALLYIIHRVEDVTEFVRVSRAERSERARSLDLERRTEAMQAEILGRSLELDAANRELRQANRRLSEIDRLKTAFFSNISHEFRTPLTLLLGPVEDALADTGAPLAPCQRERLELAHHNAVRLLKLVNALLDFSRLEAGAMCAAREATDLSALTRELASLFDASVQKAGLGYVVDCGPLSEPAYVDRDMWEKIVLNLLSNAFKFTLQGTIAVRLDEHAERFELRVSDTGSGIPVEDLPRVFERFHRVQGARARSFEGAGIGLALVQELVKLHDGEVTVESVAGQGTTFTVSIPKGHAQPLPGPAATAGAASAVNREAFAGELRGWRVRLADEADARAAQDARAARARILLADDNADLRSYVTSLLAPHYSVEAVADGEAALAAARARAPDLVLSDVMMPGLTGFELLEQLRADDRTAGVPVILLSARAGGEATVEGIEAGADDYLVKPFSARELVARVRTHLELARARRTWMETLERTNQELESFSYSVSHDLRAPLRAIDGFGRILEEEHGVRLDADGMRLLSVIRDSSRRMGRLIDDLLEFSRLGRKPIAASRIDMRRLAEEAASEIRLPGERRPELAIGPLPPAHGDATLMRQVWVNLLSNAVKFSGKRERPVIDVSGFERGAENVYCVRDNGAGFDMRYRDKLFGVFQRLHAHEEFPGTGAGLAIVHRIVTRHGGRVWAEGVPDEGAAFFFSFPRGEAHA